MTECNWRYAEYCVEQAQESETKKEENFWWKEYKRAMGDSLLKVRKPRSLTNRPSVSLKRTVCKCVCSSSSFIWTRNKIEGIPMVKFSCKCGKETGWFDSNSKARDAWNILVIKVMDY